MEATNQFEYNLDRGICEAYLWHGTDPAAASKIAEDGFDVSRGKRGRFGPGAYFAEDSGKSDQYAGSGAGVYKHCYAMLLCRVLLGRQYCTERENNPGAAKVLKAANAEYDSVLA
eukprot:gnl/TRDRNA2_/TRDRNA2_139194_c0_seq1.p2 gnl/TRDRNA2_/TRDRNA2_139194_c0~~gnl/TRDRNA2_/TRDRNA2_139194_c0_seq1.p2  ORF type:complete len:115 (-),score=15.03 gnl/TRDRNA2_/TRDRNA2_139194_c0_seq1:282-626(-)